MKEIKNIEDLRYRKLFIRSEIRVKEQKIIKQFSDLKDELNTADFKNEIVRSAMNNPSMVINIARIAYDLFTRYRKYKHKKTRRKKHS